MFNILKFHMVRHGPVHNPDKIWYGREVEFDLTSPDVVHRIDHLACVLPSDPKTTLWISSDYPRSYEIGLAILRATGRSEPPQLVQNIKFGEQKYGNMEGMRGEEARQHPDNTPYFENMWDNAPPCGESLKMLQARVGAELDILAETVPSYITDVVVMGHGGANIAGLSHATGQRMIDVFNTRRLKVGPSFSYMSRLELHFDRNEKKWLRAFEYESGLPKLAL